MDDIIEEKMKEFEEKFKCRVSGCDNNGTISEHGCNGTDEDCAATCPVPVQCQFCFEVLLPIKALFRSSLQKMYEAGRNDRVLPEGEIPMGVSQWREHGKKFGYWDAFRSSVIEECVEVVEKKRVTMNIFGESDEKNDGIVMGLEIAKEELTRLNSLKEKTQ